MSVGQMVFDHKTKINFSLNKSTILNGRNGVGAGGTNSSESWRKT